MGFKGISFRKGSPDKKIPCHGKIFGKKQVTLFRNIKQIIVISMEYKPGTLRLCCPTAIYSIRSRVLRSMSSKSALSRRFVSLSNTIPFMKGDLIRSQRFGQIKEIDIPARGRVDIGCKICTACPKDLR